MEKYIITTGKTIDLAIQNALAELSLDRDAVSVEVLENARTGFLGIGASPAKVKVTYEVPDPKPVEPAPALSAASRKPKKQAPKLEKPLEMPKPPVLPTAPEAPKAEAPKSEVPKKEAPKMEKPVRTEKPGYRSRLDFKTDVLNRANNLARFPKRFRQMIAGDNRIHINRK